MTKEILQEMIDYLQKEPYMKVYVLMDEIRNAVAAMNAEVVDTTVKEK